MRHKALRLIISALTTRSFELQATSNSSFCPFGESNDDARINVLVNGKIAETIFVKLAKSKTDYTVPFDLSKYKGQNVILDIVTPQGRSSVREAKDDVCWKGIELKDAVDTTDRETKFGPYSTTLLFTVG